MQTNKQKIRAKMPDLTRIEGGKSIGIRLEQLLKTADQYDCEGLKKEFFKILDDPTTHASKMKIQEYKENTRNKYHVNAMRIFITNIYMASAKMGLN